MSDFFHMGGYGTFIWSAYSVAAIVMVGLIVATLRTLRAKEGQLAALEAEKQSWGQSDPAKSDQ
jgi:heme exporter protein D